MEKKRSKGVTILGWLNIIVSFYIYHYAKTLLIRERFFEKLEILQSVNINHTSLSYTTVNIAGVILCVIVFIAGILVLRLKEIGRKLAIYSCIAGLLVAMFELIYLLVQRSNPVIVLFVLVLLILPAGIYIYFLTRPKVKEQFK